MKKTSILFLIASLLVSVGSLQAKKENVLSYYAIRNQVDGQILAGETNLLRFHPVFKHRAMIDTVIVALYYGSNEFTGYADRRDDGRFWQLTLPPFDLGESIQKIEVEVRMRVASRDSDQMSNVDYLKRKLVANVGDVLNLQAEALWRNRKSEEYAARRKAKLPHVRQFINSLIGVYGKRSHTLEILFGKKDLQRVSDGELAKLLTSNIPSIETQAYDLSGSLGLALAFRKTEEALSLLNANNSNTITSGESYCLQELQLEYQESVFLDAELLTIDVTETGQQNPAELKVILSHDMELIKEYLYSENPNMLLENATRAFAGDTSLTLPDRVLELFDASVQEAWEFEETLVSPETVEEAESNSNSIKQSANDARCTSNLVGDQYLRSIYAPIQLLVDYTKMPTDNQIYAQEASLRDSSSGLALGPSVEPADVRIDSSFKRVNILYRNYNEGLRRLPALDPSERVGIFRLRYIPVAVTMVGKKSEGDSESESIGEQDEKDLATMLPTSSVAPVFELGFAFGETYAASDQEIISEFSFKRLGVALALTSKLFNDDAELIGAAVTYDLNSFVSLGAGVNLAHNDYPLYYSLGVNKRLFERALKVIAEGFK